ERTRQGSVDLIRASDPLDRDHLDRLRQLFEQCLEQGQARVVLDLEKVPLIDGAGLETLLDFQETVQQRGGAMTLAAPNALCQAILAGAGVNRHFEVFPEALSAVGSFAQ